MSSSVPCLSRKSASAFQRVVVGIGTPRAPRRAASARAFLYSAHEGPASAAALRDRLALRGILRVLRCPLRIWRISSSPSRTPSAKISSYGFSPRLMSHAASRLGLPRSSPCARLTISLSGSIPSMSCCSQIAPEPVVLGDRPCRSRWSRPQSELSGSIAVFGTRAIASRATLWLPIVRWRASAVAGVERGRHRCAPIPATSRRPAPTVSVLRAVRAPCAARL